MSREPERPDPDIPQDPGIPGSKVPEEVAPKPKPRVRRVPDTGLPDSDDEGHMAPTARKATSRHCPDTGLP
jgi:hypothetical protein